MYIVIPIFPKFFVALTFPSLSLYFHNSHFLPLSHCLPLSIEAPLIDIFVKSQNFSLIQNSMHSTSLKDFRNRRKHLGSNLGILVVIFINLIHNSSLLIYKNGFQIFHHIVCELLQGFNNLRFKLKFEGSRFRTTLSSYTLDEQHLILGTVYYQ